MSGMFGFFDFGGGSGEEHLPEKRRFFLFFDLFFRKFTRLMQVNMLYIGFCLPYIMLLYWLSPINVGFFIQLGVGAEYLAMPLNNQLMFEAFLRFSFATLIITFWGAGPVSAGYQYILRNFARQEHAWIWSDFWQHLSRNFVQGLIVLAIDAAAIAAFVLGFIFYGESYIATGNSLMRIAQGGLVVVLLLYTIMHYYIYQLMVTFKASLFTLYKTSITLTVLKMSQNLLLTIICAGGLFWLIYLIEWFALLLCLIILTTAANFIIGFYATGVIKNYIINPANENDENEELAGE